MHKPVLLHEVIDCLAPEPADVVLDGTVGDGGHAEALLERGVKRLIGIDLDEGSLARARERLSRFGEKVCLVRGNFKDAPELIGSEAKSVSKILLDLGWSSSQIEGSGRGFSFQRNEPLLMTLSSDAADFTAATILNRWDEKDIENVLRGYGEERAARKLAREIVVARRAKKFATTTDLVGLIEKTIPRRGKTHPATKTFQALRIAVNDELRTLREGLPKLLDLLPHGGRMAVIAFHSVEDRVVKNLFRGWTQENRITLVTKKPLVSGRREVVENPRARSATLRSIKKI